jgi:LysM repeat protein
LQAPAQPPAGVDCADQISFILSGRKEAAVSVKTYIALFFVLVFPFISVFILRYLRSRLTALPFYSIGGILFALSGAAVIWLVQARIETVQIGSLAITQPQGIDMQLPIEIPGLDPTPSLVTTPGTVATLTSSPTAQPTGSPTLTPTAAATATARPSATPSPTPAPTATPTPSATPVAPTATPEPPPPPRRRTYTVQPGDTLRSIASDFGVTVQALINANDLTAAQADSLQPGDTLIIP